MKSMFFAPKCEAKEFLKLNISNNIKEINQHSRVTCLCCILHKTMQGGAIISKVINKKHRKNLPLDTMGERLFSLILAILALHCI